MALFRKSPPASGQVGRQSRLGVTGLELLVRHTGVTSAQYLDVLKLAENCPFLDRKLASALNETVYRHYPR